MRKFIHIDMDCFYAAVEMRDNPSLRNIPIAIGGSADRRGVISTCNYPARKFGVRSAMATAQALKLCPDLTLVKGRMDTYVEEARHIKEIMLRYTDIIEPLSLDEAFLDVSESTLYGGSATRIAEDIRATIFNETGLTASAGVAPIKFVAKVASDENKPDGLCVITPDKLDDFVVGLPLKKIPGVGKVTQEKLSTLGLETCADVRDFPREQILKRFGKFGKVLWERCHAIDEREIQVSRVRKSVGVERTFDKDITQVRDMIAIMKDKLIPELERRAAKYLDAKGMNKLGVKVKFADFQQTTKEQVATKISVDILEQLLLDATKRGNGKSVRLIGVHIGLMDEKPQSTQLDFGF